MEILFREQQIVVTGAAKGIGAAVVRLFADSGAFVHLLDLDEKEGRKLASQIGSQAKFYPCNVSNATQVEQVLNAIGQITGIIDVLVNNAGIQTYGNILTTSEDVWEKTISVNLKSVFLCSKYAVPFMERAFQPSIVNISSAQALVCETNVMAYVTSKAGVLGLTRAMAVDLAPKIRVVAICPGAVQTPMLATDVANAADPEKFLEEASNIHLTKHIASPEEVAGAVLFAASSYASNFTGQYLRIDGGIGTKIVPL